VLLKPPSLIDGDPLNQIASQEINAKLLSHDDNDAAQIT
jgi:hypothetical protein